MARMNVMLLCMLALMPAVSSMSLVVDSKTNCGPPSPVTPGGGGGLQPNLPADAQGALQIGCGPAQPVPEPPTPPADGQAAVVDPYSTPSQEFNAIQQQQQTTSTKDEVAVVVEEEKKETDNNNNVQEEKKEEEKNQVDQAAEQQQQQQQQLAQVDCSTLCGPAKNPPPPEPISPSEEGTQNLAQLTVECGPPADVDPKRPGVGCPQKKPVRGDDEQQQQVLVQVNCPQGRPVDPSRTGVECPQKKPLVDDHLSTIIDAQSLVDCNCGPPAPPPTPPTEGGL